MFSNSAYKQFLSLEEVFVFLVRKPFKGIVLCILLYPPPYVCFSMLLKSFLFFYIWRYFFHYTYDVNGFIGWLYNLHVYVHALWWFFFNSWLPFIQN